MQHYDNEDREYPEPATILAIRGAISTGQMGGPIGPPGHWLNEFWQIGAALRDHAEMLQGFQGKATVAFAYFGASNRPISGTRSAEFGSVEMSPTTL